MTLPFLQRLWIYQGERFPIGKVAILLSAFTAAGISCSARLAEIPLASLGTYLTGFTLVFILFLQMRICDEAKDMEDDRQYRPERPIPRGLISLPQLMQVGLLAGFFAVAIAFFSSLTLVLLLGVVWLWLTAMTLEFGAPEWLKSNPIAYLISHMLIMPLIALMVTGAHWIHADFFPPQLLLFFALSFFNGLILEIGRKLLAPSNEREGVETYSGLWGPKVAAYVWLGCLGLALLLICLLSWSIGSTWTILIFLALAGACGWLGWDYANNPTPKSQSYLDTAASLWVLLGYASLAIAAFLSAGPL